MTIFPGAHGNVFNNSTFIYQAPGGDKRPGLEKLLDASIPGASHDSSERYPPPICHPGTREEYIQKLTQLRQNPDDHVDRITWLKGPAGVGKSAIAQSCADALHTKKKLGASFFFSRPNHRDNPDHFFTTLAYQLAVKYNAYGTHLDEEIGRDPTIVTKSLPHQFHLLFIIPFSQPAILEEVGERVIIVDGLDECVRSEAQVDIIKIIADSVRANTTPFIWIFLSRLEPIIVTTFNLPDIKSISQHIDLPVSREINQEILHYLADKLKDIGSRHGLTLPWPSEEVEWKLVDFCDGLFACAHAIVYFVSMDKPEGPVGLLDAVLKLAKRSATRSGQQHPLSALDELYTLIMERVPPAMLQTVQWILVSTRIYKVEYACESANLTGLSELQFRSACRCLHSVLSLNTGDRARIRFYHASFMDFLEDPARSGRFHLWSDCAITLLEEILRHLDQPQIVVNEKAPNGYGSRLDLTWPTTFINRENSYTDHIAAFFKILGSVRLCDDVQRYHALTNFDFRKISFDFMLGPEGFDPELFMQNLDSRLKLLRPSTFRSRWVAFESKDDYRYYIIGDAEKRVLLMVDSEGRFDIHPYSLQRWMEWAKRICNIQQYTGRTNQALSTPSCLRQGRAAEDANDTVLFEEVGR